MLNWNELREQIRHIGSPYDIIRREAIRDLSRIVGRNVIVYYSGWLQKPDVTELDVNDLDKIAFMTVVHPDRSTRLFPS
ncbi:MAG: hypothetical protein FWD57_12235 [Polyangiaceae bacterium]|nr:hypothetical protein [Polyangiaceae bacterium]